VKKIQTHVQQIMGGFAKARRQPTAEEVRQVRREPDRQQREAEARFIQEVQMQRRGANFHAVQEPSVDWNQPPPAEQRLQAIRTTSQPVVPKTQPAAQDAEQPSEDPTSRIEQRLNMMLEETRRKLVSFNDEGPQEGPRYPMEAPRFPTSQYMTIVNPQYREAPFFTGERREAYGGFQSARDRQSTSREPPYRMYEEAQPMLISYGGSYHTHQQFLAMAPPQQHQPYIVIPHI
jgi:hypothetical protein